MRYLAAAVTFAVLVAQVAGQRRIVGGSGAEPKQFPYQVLIIPRTSFGAFGYCSGALLSSEWVLTAARCLDEFTNFTVVLGAYDISKPSEDNRQEFYTTAAVIHPGFHYNAAKNDIGLLKLPQAAILNDHVSPIRLPSEEQRSVSFWWWQGIMSGWGDTRQNDVNNPSVLRWLQSKVVSNFYCYLRHSWKNVYESNICVSGFYAKGTCFGDSGDPLVVKDSDGKLTLIGVSSYEMGCELSLPPVFTRVSSYLDWIAAQTGITLSQH